MKPGNNFQNPLKSCFEFQFLQRENEADLRVSSAKILRLEGNTIKKNESKAFLNKYDPEMVRKCN